MADTAKIEALMRSAAAASAPTTFMDGIEERMQKIKTTAKDSAPAINAHKQTDVTPVRDPETAKAEGKTVVRDSYGNSLLAIGTDDKVKSFTNYGLSNDTLNWMLWLALYNDSWVFRRAIDKPAQDEIRCGITLRGLDPEEVAKIEKDRKKYVTDLIQLLMWGALFGGSVACVMFDNVTDVEYSKPMDPDRIRSSKTMRLYVTDRWYGVSPSYDNTVENMASMDFGKPKYYGITFPDGGEIYFHHDYVIRYDHRVAPKLVKSMLSGWGYAEGSHILNELTRDDKLKASIQSLVDKSLIEVIKMSGMRGVFMGADADNNRQLEQRLEMVNWGRSFNSLTFLDKDDDYIQHDFSGLAGLSDLLANNMWLISSALEMQGVLFGDLKTGFSNDESALERYDETINNRCESYVRPVYDKLLKILYIKNGINKPVEYDFNSLLINKRDEDRMKAISDFTDLLDKLLNSGIIDPAKYAKMLQDFSQKNIVNFDFSEDELRELKSSAALELEGIDLSGGPEKENAV